MVSPSTDNRPNAPSPFPQRRLWLWAIAVISMGIGGGAAAGWYFLRYRLIPVLEAQLEPILGRPVDLGEIEALSLSGARLGPSELPPTESDPDRVEIAAVVIDYDLGEILQQRVVNARVTVENPRIYIEQAEDGAWLDLDLNLPEPTEEDRSLPVTIARVEATVRETEVILVPRALTGELGAQYRARFPEIAATATEDLERVAFDLDGVLEAGTLEIAGDFAVPTGRLEVSQAQLQSVALAQFLPLLPIALPISELQGEISANLALAAQLDDPMATFEGTGTIALEDIAATLPQLKEAATAAGELRLQGSSLEIERLAARVGELEASVAGNVDLQAGYNLTATLPETPIAVIFAAAELENPPVDVRGAIAATARATGALDAPQVSATLRTPAPLAIDRAILGIVEADARLDDTRAILDGLRVDAPDGGQVRAKGEFDLDSGDWSGELIVRELDGEIARPYVGDRPPLTDLGRLNAEGRGRGNLQAWTTTVAEGNFAWAGANGRLAVPKLQLANRRLQADVDIASVALQPFVPALPATVEPLSGQLELRAQLPAKLPADSDLLETLRASARGQFQVAGGDLRLQEARLQGGRWQVQTALAELPIAALLPEETALDRSRSNGLAALARLPYLTAPQDSEAVEPLPPEPPAANTVPGLAGAIALLQPTTLGAQVRASGRVDRLNLEAIDLTGSARLDDIAAGTVNVPTFSLKEGQGRVQIQPTAVRLDLMTTALGAPVLIAPTPVAGELEVTAPVAELAALSADDLSVLADVRANGQFNFSNGLAVVTEPLSATVAWDGSRLNLLQASAPSFAAEGFVTLNPQATGLEIVGPYDLSVAAAELDLARVPVPPEAIALRGSVSMNGRASGGGLRNPPPQKAVVLPQDVAIAPQFSGDLRLRNLAINDYTFDPEISGTMRADLERGLALALSGPRDRLEVAATLAAPERPLPVEPQKLHLRLREAEITGERSGDEFQVSLANIPLRQLQPLLPLASIPDIAGSLSGNLAVDLSNFDGRGSLEISQFQAARIFRSNLVSADFTASPSAGRFALSEGRLQVGESDYRLQAEANLDPEDWQNFDKLAYEARLEAPRVHLRDVFSMLQLQTVADLSRSFGGATYGNASDLDITPIELANASLGDRLERLNAIGQEVAVLRSQQTTTALLPPFSAIEGDFSLAAEIAGRGIDPLAAKGQVTLDGRAWQWGNLGAQETTVRLEMADGRLTLLPLRLATGDSSIELTGSTDLNFEDLSASLAVRDVPVELARNFVEFPPAIGFGGKLEANVTAAGSPAAPSATGEFSVADATINSIPIDRVEGGFTYNRSQLLFAAESALTEDSQPVTVVGTVPLQLPTSPVPPPSDRLEVRVALKDESLAFLDVLTNNQLKWGGGKAAVELEIAGPFDAQNLQAFQPDAFVADGRATLTDVQLISAVLAKPITGITGEAIFDLQALRTEGIRAQLGGGEIAIAGALPFFTPSDDRLVATIGELEVDALEGLFKSRVEGTLLVGGTALATRIGGDLRVFKGTLDLANLPAAETPADEPVLTAATTPIAAAESLPDKFTGEEPDRKSALAASLQLDSELPTNSCSFAPDTPLLLQDLNVEVGSLFDVSVPFIADFFTEGKFVLDGPLLDVPQICPEGNVTLTRGTVAIGSTRFRLDNEQTQMATFVPEQGLDPTLDVSLQAQVVETTRQPEITDPSQAEISEDLNTGSDFGAAQSVRISAIVRGRATSLLTENELEEILTLESTPRRSDGEILALLGQGVLGGGSALGLASSLTGGLQAAIADALGLSQFSLFPIAIADSGESAEGDGGNSTSIQLAAETGIDLTNKVTFSVLAILTQQQPLLYSLRYRVSDKISVRGLTDFSANDRLTVDYETRF